MKDEEVIRGLKVLRKDFSGYKPNEEMFDAAIEAVQERMERKTGKWIRQGGIHNMYTSYACSECRREIEMYYDFGNIPTDADVINEFPYCHCGARMEVDE